MSDGRLKIGSDFLKIGDNYLRIGPGAPYFVVTDGTINDAGTGGNVPHSETRVIVNPQDGNYTLWYGVIALRNGGPPDTCTLGGDLTWTLQAQLDQFPVGQNRALYIFSAPMTALDPASISISISFVAITHFQANLLRTVYTSLEQLVSGEATSVTDFSVPYAAFALPTNHAVVFAFVGSAFITIDEFIRYVDTEDGAFPFGHDPVPWWHNNEIASIEWHDEFSGNVMIVGLELGP